MRSASPGSGLHIGLGYTKPCTMVWATGICASGPCSGGGHFENWNLPPPGIAFRLNPFGGDQRPGLAPGHTPIVFCPQGGLWKHIFALGLVRPVSGCLCFCVVLCFRVRMGALLGGAPHTHFLTGRAIQIFILRFCPESFPRNLN